MVHKTSTEWLNRNKEKEQRWDETESDRGTDLDYFERLIHFQMVNYKSFCSILKG